MQVAVAAVVAARRGRRTSGHGDVAVGRRRDCPSPADAANRRDGDRIDRRPEHRLGGDAASRLTAASVEQLRADRSPRVRGCSHRGSRCGPPVPRVGSAQRPAARVAAGERVAAPQRRRQCRQGARHRRSRVGAAAARVPVGPSRRLRGARESVFGPAGARSGAARLRRGAHRRDRRRRARTPRLVDRSRSCRRFSSAWWVVRTHSLPDRLDDIVAPALLAATVGIALWVGWLLFRPAVAPRVTSFRPLSRERARFIVERYGTDSLSYFALRDDKEWFGFRDTMVAYRVHNGVALVSPDPIGPVGQRAEAWGSVPRVRRRARLAGGGDGRVRRLAARRIARAVCTTSTSVTRPSSTCAVSASTASRTRACASRWRASRSPAIASSSSIPPSSTRRCARSCATSWPRAGAATSSAGSR